MNSEIKSLLRASLCAFLLSVAVPVCGMDSTEEKDFNSDDIEVRLSEFVQNGLGGVKSLLDRALSRTEVAEEDNAPDNLVEQIKVDAQETIGEVIDTEQIEEIDRGHDLVMDIALDSSSVSMPTSGHVEGIATNSYRNLLCGATFVGLAGVIGYFWVMRESSNSSESLIEA